MSQQAVPLRFVARAPLGLSSLALPQSSIDPIQPLLSIQNLTLEYTTPDRIIRATHRVSFDVLEGDRFVVLGPSGCGKSTLLKAVGGFVTPVEGAIHLAGRPVSGPGPDRLVVFQEFDQLPPWKTVLDNVVFPLVVTGRLKRREAREKAAHVLAKVGLSKFLDAYPHTLSGGMKQRVAIARALAMEPAILLMDEPFAALDGLTRRRMHEELLALWAEVRFTLLFVTHAIEEAVAIGSRLLLMSAHPGQVRAELDAHSVGGDRFREKVEQVSSLLFDPTAR